MGSYSPPPPKSSLPSESSPTTRKSIHVFVTGFGSFHTIRLNPSHLIAIALPPTLTTSHHDIHIHAHPAPIPVSYKYVREVIPKLLFPPSAPPDPHALLAGEKKPKSSGRVLAGRSLLAPSLPAKPSVPNLHPPSSPSPPPPQSPSRSPYPAKTPEQQSKPLYDLTLFIGVAPKRKDYSVETRARRDGYEDVDADGKHVGKYAFPKREDVPEVLQAGVDGHAVLERWREGFRTLPPSLGPPPTLSLSKDAGHYLCEFIYYTGLWEHYKREPPPERPQTNPARKRPVLFLHVPGGVKAADIALGARVAEALIAAAAGWWEEDRGLYTGQLEGFGGGRGKKEGNEERVEGGTLRDAEGKGWEGS